MPKKNSLRNRALASGNLWLRKKRLVLAVFAAAICAAFLSCGAARGEESAGVALPSRFAETVPEGTPPAGGTVVRAPVRAAVIPPSQYLGNTGKQYFMFGGAAPKVLCRVARITDIELEPGERVEDFSISDGAKWSISASWSGSDDNLVTHVMLQTFFPGIRSNLKIFTDRRVYEMELVSGANVEHMDYIGFRYPGAPEAEPEEEEVQPGRYRDLLVTYGLIEDGTKPGEAEASREPALVDGTELNFRYVMDFPGKKKPSWGPQSVYDADGKTYIVMPRPRRAAQETSQDTAQLPFLYIVDGGERFITRLTQLKDGLYVADRLFDEAVIRMAGKEEITIRRAGF